MQRNIALYPWFQFFRSLLFWQAIWFLYFQQTLSASEAILLYAIFDISTTALEVPSGYMSDRIGRRLTLCASALASFAGTILIVVGDSFLAFAVAQFLLGAGAAFASGTDSALLYESLAREGRSDEIERHEIRAWRASFTALAFSAAIGGLLSGIGDALPYAASAATGLVAVGLALAFREPPHVESSGTTESWLAQRDARPVLIWIFCLAVSMYIFSHVPFVFGQPFILEALAGVGLQEDAPLVSGGVTAAMMMISVATSWLAPGLRRGLGLTGMLLLALGIQIFLIGSMAFSSELLAVALLLLRMVPNSLARPFILARIQPLLADSMRATYLSMQSFLGRMLLAGSLVVFSFDASSEREMSFDEIHGILVWYLLAGLAVLVVLAFTRRHAQS